MASSSTPFGQMSVAQLQAGLAAKEFSCHEVAAATLDVIEEADAPLHAFLEVTRDAALAAADALDARVDADAFAQAGALAGVPVGYKDNMNLVGTHTTCASNML